MTLSAHAITAKVSGVPLASTIYSQGFASVHPTSDAWTATAGTTIDWFVGGRTDNHMKLTVAALGAATASRTVTGLVVGKAYAVDGWLKPGVGTPTHRIGVAGIGATAYTAAASSTVWERRSYDFTATATSHVIQLSVTPSAIGTAADWDDIAVIQDPGVTIGDVALSVIDADLALDEAWSPYSQGRLLCYTPETATLDKIDPRLATGLRVSITVARTLNLPSGRTFDLALRSREVDHETGTMTLVVESDEALADDYALLTTTPERTYGLSIKTAVVYALAKIGAVLEAGAADANLVSKVLEPVRTNVITNPSAEVNTTGSTASGITLTRDTVAPISGTASYKLAASGAADSFFTLGTGAMQHGMTPGKTYTASGTVRIAAPVTGLGTLPLQVVYLYRVGAGAYSVVSSPSAPNVAGTYRLSVTFTVPAGASESYVRFYLGATAGTIWWDNLLLEESPSAGSYFDGSTNDGLWVGSWTGTAHASTSTATNLANSDATIWQPGVSAWDFMAPLVQAGGLKVYCDEARKWRLINGNLAIDGVVTIAGGFNATSGKDLIARTDDGDWYSGVCIRYQWDDKDGKPQTVYDIAGTPAKVRSSSYQRPYPGPGAAAAVLARAIGRGRVYDLSAISSYDVQPGKQLVATLPNTSIQVGVVSAVGWQFPADEMSVKSRGLIETPPTAWIFDAAGLSWASLAVGIDWTEDI